MSGRDWIPAFAGMTMPGTGALNKVIAAQAGTTMPGMSALNIVIPAKAGIHRPRRGQWLNHARNERVGQGTGRPAGLLR